MLKMWTPFRLAVALIAVAGFVDAVGFLQLGNLFVSFMSGNSTQFAASLGQGQWTACLQAGAIIGLFVLGAFAGALVAIAAGSKRLPVVLLLEAGLLACALLFPSGRLGEFSLAAAPMALAMGFQNAAMNRIGERTVSLTYVTGTLVRFARELAEAVTGRGERWAWSADLLFWLAIVIGAVLGAKSFAWFGLRSLVVPLAAVILLGLGALVSPPPSADAQQARP
jgi:uncharacterized membrane protein YoaK (UPF0700 family)